MSTQPQEGESSAGISSHDLGNLASVPTTEAEAHYRSLTDFFKYLVTIVLSGMAVLIGVGLYVTNKDMSAMRAEVRQNVSDVKSDLRQSLSDVKSDTKTAVDSTREGANSAIKGTENAAEAQISQIRGQSASIALNEAQKRVDDAFRNRNVETLVENAAKQQVAPVIERQLQGEVDRAMFSLRGDISYLSEIGDAASILRGGGRPGFDRLVTLQKQAPNENMRLRAKTLLAAIGDDYEKVTAGARGQLIENDLAQEALRSHAKELERFDESTRRTRLIPILIREIRTNDDPFAITQAFLALRNLTNYPFRVFDIEAIDRWCTENTTQCQ